MARTRWMVERSTILRFALLILIGFLPGVHAAFAQYPLEYPTTPQIEKDGTAVLLEDYANLPLSGTTHFGKAPGPIDLKGQLGRVTSMRSEPADAPLAASRFFVNDESSTIYILDKATMKFTPYINFADVFPKFESDSGLAAGVVSITFDPDYAKNGKFYTVHVEKPDVEGSATPTNSKLTGLNVKGYTTTPRSILPRVLCTSNRS